MSDTGSHDGDSRDAEFRDARLVEVYDAECPWSRDDDFFLQVVVSAGARRVLDLGCGTGRLALAMARAGLQVTGVDPAAASLAAARAKPGSAAIDWLTGTAEDVTELPEAAFDAALMTSHVAQFILEDEAWNAALKALRRALVDDGVLTFDSRDPCARAWERWNPRASARSVTLASGTRVDALTEVESREDDRVSFVHRYAFEDGSHLESRSTLRFRSETVLRDSLAAADFELEALYGGWAREPVGASDGEFLVIARAR